MVGKNGRKYLSRHLDDFIKDRERVCERLMMLLALLLFGIGFLYFELETLKVSRFYLKTEKLKHKIKIVHLSDLHSKEFGVNNERLIKKVRELKPDLIVTTGDMISSTDHNGDAFLSVAAALSDQIPMYYIEGNHELTARYDTLNLENGWYETYLNDLRALGVHVLKNDTNLIQLQDVKLHIQGLTVPLAHYCAVPEKISAIDDIHPIKKVSDVLEPTSPHHYNILLAHNPFLIPIYLEHEVDLICCGHVHGGAVRLPFIGGILSPERKLFPKYSGGHYRFNSSNLIVSRGLGRLRLFNRPDVVMIEINPE